MQRRPLAVYALVAIVSGALFLTGCDLLGQKSKKQNNASNGTSSESQTTAVAQNPSPSGPMPADALVRIGNWTLTSEEFNSRLNLLKQQLPEFKANDPNAKGAVLDELIRQELLVQDAQDSGIGNSQDIKDAVEDFRKTLLVQELASRMTKDVMATETDAHAYYEANKDKFVEPATWQVSEIVTKDEDAAKNILVQVLQGGDFAQIAQAQSKASNAAQGGKLLAFTKAPFEAMQTAIANLDTGGVSGVFKGPEGYYIVKVDSKTGGAPRPFADLKKDLIYGLTMQKQQVVLLNRLKELAEKYKPQYNKELIEQTIGRPSNTNAPNAN